LYVQRARYPPQNLRFPFWGQHPAPLDESSSPAEAIHPGERMRHRRGFDAKTVELPTWSTDLADSSAVYHPGE
jgi:hypothetical protein